MSANIEGMLNEAQRELDAGRSNEAMTLLLRVTELDERNETAWFLLAQAVGTDDEKRTCLDNVLIINPNNEGAREMLNDLDRAGDDQIMAGDDPFGMEGGFSASDFGESSAPADDSFSTDTSFDTPATTPDDSFDGPFGMEDEDMAEPEAPPPPVSRVPASEASESMLGDVYEDESIGENYDYDADDISGDYDYDYGHGDDVYGMDDLDNFEDDDPEDDLLGMIPDDVRPTRSPGMNEKPNTGLIVGISLLGVLNVLAIVALVLQFVG